jgi:hypothetical protein
MERLIEQYSGHRTLEFDNSESASVTYRIDDFQDFISDRWAAGARVAEGHPDWHPIVSLNPGPFTLVMRDGRKLKVF